MKILSLKIEGYKNLRSSELVNFNLENCTNFVALIGINGSGKSNVLEAISIIFSDLYHDKKSLFKYFIEYEIPDAKVKITDAKMSVAGIQRFIPKSDFYKYLPENIIASYSGEELRMWEGTYLDSYSIFFQDIKKQSSSVPKLLYLNKYSWEFALITLLCSDDPIVQKFLNDVLKVSEDVEVSFNIEKNNYGLYENNDALSLIKRIVSLQEESKNNSIHINTIKSLDINQKDNKDFTKKLFYYLFVTGMPVKGDRIKADKIIRNTTVKFNGIDVRKLSEGEKKLILLLTITNILSNERTLVLLDEPDAHIHIDRKKEIVDIINKENCFTLFTTHSPKLLHYIDNENIRIIRNSAEKGLEVIFLDKISALEEITNGEFSVVDATLALSTSNDILLVEGEYDFLYINEAIKRLNILKANKYNNFNFTIINCGGAGNVPAIFKEIIAPNLKSTQVCIATFDGDQAGKDGIKGIEKILLAKPMSNVGTMTHTPLAGWDPNKEFFMEDYFPIATYRKILLEDINSKTKIKDFQQLSKDTVKGIINSNYRTFDDNDFLNFELLLDSIITLQKKLRTPKKAIVKKSALVAAAKPEKLPTRKKSVKR